MHEGKIKTLKKIATRKWEAEDFILIEY